MAEEYIQKSKFYSIVFGDNSGIFILVCPWKTFIVGIHYAPNFEEVGGAYCFWDVCVSVRPSIMLFDA